MSVRSLSKQGGILISTINLSKKTLALALVDLDEWILDLGLYGRPSMTVSNVF